MVIYSTAEAPSAHSLTMLHNVMGGKAHLWKTGMAISLRAISGGAKHGRREPLGIQAENLEPRHAAFGQSASVIPERTLL